jgi:C2H2 transcription facotor
MSGFRAVNTTLSVQDPPPGRLGEETTPTTPKPNKFFQPEQSADASRPPLDESSVKTPTRDNFNGMKAQQPLPSAPFTPPSQEAKPVEPASAPQAKVFSRASSHRSTKSLDSNIDDMDIDEDGEGQNGASDNESTTSDSRPTKKKKGQKFFCTEFPPCTLSFTRSEHLARHIRFVPLAPCRHVNMY